MDIVKDESPHTSFSFDMNGPIPVPPSGSSSPRTNVAHRFRGLALADHGPVTGSGPSGPSLGQVGPAGAHQSGAGAAFGGGGVGVVLAAAHHDNAIAKPASSHSNSSMHMDVDENEAMMRKRTRISPSTELIDGPLRISSPRAEITETPVVPKTQPPGAADATFQLPTTEPAKSAATTTHFVFDQAIFTSSPRSSPSKIFTQQPPLAPSNRPVDAVKTRVRKRAGTPPLMVGRKTTTTTTQTNNDTPTDDEARPAEITDPIRAALTWHEDEITVYDPEDEDDDGVGINGIGFKPTPAIAYARTMKRRQQLAEYRKREEREARARRNLRRRGSPERQTSATRNRSDSAARKVRFTEAEPSMMIETI